MRKFTEQDRKNVINILVKSFEGNKSVDFVVGNSSKRGSTLKLVGI